MTKKGAVIGPFVLNPRLLILPRLNGREAVLSFPLLQCLVVASLGFDHFAGMRVFINLQLTRLTAARFGLGNWSAPTCLRIKQVDHIFQAVALLTQQRA